MKTAIVAALALASSAHAEVLFRLSDSMWVWNGGFAANIGNGWIGSGWDRFPGVSPPWNPVGSVQPPPVMVVPMPQPEPPAPPELHSTGGFQNLFVPPPRLGGTLDILIGDTIISTPRTW